MKREDYTPGGHLTQAFVDMIDAGNAQAQLILKAIAQHADWETGECYPAATSIAEIAKCSVKTVRRYLRQLESDELIKTEPRYLDGDGEDGRQSSNKIILVGYAEWVVASRKGGTVPRARKVRKYASPPGQDDQGGHGQVDQGGDGQSDQGPLDKVSSAPGHILSMAPGHMVSTHNEPSLEHQSNDSPPPPQGAGEGDFKIDWIEDLRAEGVAPQVLDDFLIPMLKAGLKPWKDVDPKGPARQLGQDFKRRSGPVLNAAADRLLSTEKYRLPPVAKCREAVEAEGKIAAAKVFSERKQEEAQAGEIVRFDRGSPEFDAELAKWKASDPAWAARIEREGFVKLRRKDAA